MPACHRWLVSKNGDGDSGVTNRRNYAPTSRAINRHGGLVLPLGDPSTSIPPPPAGCLSERTTWPRHRTLWRFSSPIPRHDFRAPAVWKLVPTLSRTTDHSTSPAAGVSSPAADSNRSRKTVKLNDDPAGCVAEDRRHRESRCCARSISLSRKRARFLPMNAAPATSTSEQRRPVTGCAYCDTELPAAGQRSPTNCPLPPINFVSHATWCRTHSWSRWPDRRNGF